MNSHKNIKIVLLGTTGSGKTSLVTSFLYGYPLIPKKPTLFGAFYRELNVNGFKYRLNICDTAGTRELIKLQEMTFLDADLLVVCSACGDKSGLKKAELYIEPCIKTRIPILLCITKTDLGRVISQEEIINFIEQYKLNGKIECTIQDNQSIRKAFEKMIECANSESVVESGYCGKLFKCC